MNKETIAEAAENYSNKTEEYVLKCRINKESISHLGLYLGFIEGANWQAERMYSEEEVKQIIDATLIAHSDFVLADVPEWFEQFKKK